MGSAKLVRLVLAVAVGAALAVLTPGSASATPAPTDFVTVTTKVFDDGLAHPPNPAHYVVGTANCPDGYRVAAAAMSHAEMKTLIPTANFVGVEASGRVTDAAPNNYMIVQAICSPNTQLTDIITRTQVFDQVNGFYSGSVRCPDGYFAFGGGASMYNTVTDRPSTDDTARLIRNWPTNPERSLPTSSPQWGAAGRSNSTSTDRLLIKVQCAPVTTTAFGMTIKGFAAWGEGFIPLSLNCPAGFTALSGGAYINTTATSTGAGVIRESTPIGTSGWAISVGSALPDPTRILVSVVCIQ